MSSMVPFWAKESETFIKGIAAQVDHLRKELSEDQDLFMYYWHGPEKLRALGLSNPSDNVIAVLSEDKALNQFVVVGGIHAFSFSLIVESIAPRLARRPIGFDVQ